MSVFGSIVPPRARPQVSLADAAFPFSVARRAARPPHMAALWRRLLDARLGGALTPADVDALWTTYARRDSASAAAVASGSSGSGSGGCEGRQSGTGGHCNDADDAATGVLKHAGAFHLHKLGGRCVPLGFQFSNSSPSLWCTQYFFAFLFLRLVCFLPVALPDVCALLEDLFLASLARLGPLAVGDAARTHLLRRVPALALRVMNALATMGSSGDGSGGADMAAGPISAAELPMVRVSCQRVLLSMESIVVGTIFCCSQSHSLTRPLTFWSFWFDLYFGSRLPRSCGLYAGVDFSQSVSSTGLDRYAAR